MSLILGLDTGGTFTDAAIIEQKSRKVIVSAKSLTTPENLILGLSDCVEIVLKKMPSKYKHKIDLVVLSSTLATNAVVNGIGEVISLILIGYEKNILFNKDLKKVIEGNFINIVKGGHDAQGNTLQELDVKHLKKIIEKQSPDVSSYAVTSHFAVRNPDHEKKSSRYHKKYFKFTRYL